MEFPCNTPTDDCWLDEIRTENHIIIQISTQTYTSENGPLCINLSIKTYQLVILKQILPQCIIIENTISF